MVSSSSLFSQLDGFYHTLLTRQMVSASKECMLSDRLWFPCLLMFSVSVVTVPGRLLAFDVMLFFGVGFHSASGVSCFLCDAVFGCRLSQCQRGFLFFI